MSKQVLYMKVKCLLFEQEKYVVPLYQRGYDWDLEIEQLVDDLLDAQARHPNKSYNLGSLVVDRSDAGFELIDGQQRLTTLHIVAAALGVADVQDNLAFECRSESSASLQNIRAGVIGSDAISRGFQIAKKAIAQKIENKAAFIGYFLNKVRMLRIEVLRGTDLNHYFEIMNSRGEQLERHEVLKARLMEKLSHDEQAAFAAIWDACSDMRCAAVQGFAPPVGRLLFGKSGKEVPDHFFQILQEMHKQNEEGDTAAASIMDLINPGRSQENNKILEQKKEAEDGIEVDAIIDFPNFLMHVLCIHAEDEGITLNDAYLTEEFERLILRREDGAESVKKFAINLLKCRLLFDEFIIKSDSGLKKEWRIENPQAASLKRLCMLQTMLHFSFMSKSHKSWLLAALQYLFGLEKTVSSKAEGLMDCLDAWCKARIRKSPIMENDHACDFRSDPPHFVFNYLDYLIWLHAGDEDWQALGVGEQHDIARLRVWVDNFLFASRNSVEHYAPQNPEKGERQEKVDWFGNLCLIDGSQNSSLGNKLPEDKRRDFLSGKKSMKSLKQALMMSCQEWDGGAIEKHHHDMLALLRKAAV